MGLAVTVDQPPLAVGVRFPLCPPIFASLLERKLRSRSEHLVRLSARTPAMYRWLGTADSFC